MNKHSVTACLIAGALFTTPAWAQAMAAGNSQIANLSCQDIASLSQANQAALIYYAAGYQDGLVDGAAAGTAGAEAATGSTGTSSSMSSDAGAASTTSSSMSSTSSDTSTSASSDSSGSTGSSSTGATSEFVGGLGLDATRVFSACAQTPSGLLSDAILAAGGTAGNSGSASGGSSGTNSSSSMGSDTSSSAMDSSSAGASSMSGSQ